MMDKTSGKLSFTHGGVKVDADCWYKETTPVTPGNQYSGAATYMANKTDSVTKGRRPGIFITQFGARGIFIHEGKNVRWSDNCIVLNREKMLLIFDCIQRAGDLEKTAVRIVCKKPDEASTAGSVSSVLAALGVSDAPLTRQGVKTAIDFFDSRMGHLRPDRRMSYMKGIDFHKPVNLAHFHTGALVCAFRRPQASSSLQMNECFFTKTGTSPLLLGINPSGRVFSRYEFVRSTLTLESRCAEVRDWWTDPSQKFFASGGGLQYIVPNAHISLRVKS